MTQAFFPIKPLTPTFFLKRGQLRAPKNRDTNIFLYKNPDLNIPSAKRRSYVCPNQELKKRDTNIFPKMDQLYVPQIESLI